jgi:hypothetical protein
MLGALTAFSKGNTDRKAIGDKNDKPGGKKAAASSSPLAGIFEGLDLNHHSESKKGGVLLIGLGGAGLAIHIRHMFPKLNMDIVELDPEIVSIAKEWFMFEEDEHTHVHIGDGLEFVQRANTLDSAAKWDVVIIDVDAKDNSSGMTCPPKSFVEMGFLGEVKNVLSSDGIMLMNVSARSQTNFDLAVDNISNCFLPPGPEGKRGMVWHLQPAEDDVNRLVVASKRQHRLDELVGSGIERGEKAGMPFSQMMLRLGQATAVKLGQISKPSSEDVSNTVKKSGSKGKGKKKKGKK